MGGCGEWRLLWKLHNKTSVVTKALVVETEAEAEAAGFETEAEARGSYLILLAVPITICN